MLKYKKSLRVHEDKKNSFILIGPYLEKFKRDLWFSAVQIKKNYVSFHLMTVCMYSDLAKTIPASLKKRMQGKSCFNFKKVDKDLFKQLAEITDRSYKTFNQRGGDITCTC